MEAKPLLSLAVSVVAERSVQGVLDTIVEGLAAQSEVALARIWLLFPGDICSVCVMRERCSDHRQCLHLAASAGTPLNSPGENWSFLHGHFSRMPLNSVKVGKVGTGTPILIQDFALENEKIDRPEWAEREGIRSFAGHPLIFRGNKLGALALFSRQPLDEQGFSWLRMFADQAAVAIANARAFEDRKRAEEALRESEENLARTEQFSLVMATHTDLEGRWLKVPPTLCKLLGYTEEELLGRRFHEFTHPDDAEADWNQYSRLIRGEIKSFDLEKRCIRKDGSIVWVYVNVSIVLDASGALVHFRTYIKDITQRKQWEQALRQSEERYRTLAETATDVILTIDQTSTIRFVNGAVEKAFGYTPAEIVGQKITALMPERMRHRHEEAMRRYLETGEKRISWNAVSLLGLHKNGREINLDVSFAETGTGNERFFSGIIRDVTERKRTEETLRKTQAELAHVTRVATLGEMSASIAHEVNQPLTAVVNSASACLRWLDAQKLEEARRSASRAIAEGHRASEIIGRIRSLTKKAPPQKDWLNVNKTIHEVIAFARSEIQRNNIALETDLSEHVPVILADRIELQQVILNLVMNGIEAMDTVTDRPREIVIRCSAQESDRVLVAVQDSGIGIDAQNPDKIFDTFYTTKPQGMGMGLAINRSIIEAHGGRLWATVNPDKGATFQFVLPVVIEKVA